MDERRPDPDELLARVQAQDAQQVRGRVKIFFGAAAGVGKTYAMLEGARAAQAAGVDVVAGWVDTHGRAETEALLRGLEVLPRRLIPYRGATLPEFDLDAALARRPALILVDELAHTNTPGSRHAKRWQDVEELLQAGIDVYTTVNVQHLESLNDVVAQITGVAVRETIPDAILEQADDVELIDLPPDELLQRLQQGKVYVPHQAEQAVRHFFRKGNLIALRELALRRTADRVDAQMRDYMRDHAIPRTWPAVERILVCVSPSPLAARLIRAARRMAAGLHAEWVAAYVETPRHLQLKAMEQARVVQTLHLAEQLGAEVVTLSGANVSDEILAYARRRNVTKIVVGKPTHPRWRDVLYGSLLDDLVRDSGDIDIHVIRGDQAAGQSPSPIIVPRALRWSAYGGSVAVVVACTLLARLMVPHFTEANLVMVYLLGVALVATRLGRGPAVLASVLSVAAFDLFLVPPFYTFAVADTQYIVTFGVMLGVALLISTLTVRLHAQAQIARDREQRTAALFALSRDLTSSGSIQDLLRAAVQHISAVFSTQVAVLSSGADAVLGVQVAAPGQFPLDTTELGVAQWVVEHGQMAGAGTDTVPGAGALYLPLKGSQRTVGVLAIRPKSKRPLWEPEQLHLLSAFASQTAVAVERAYLAEEAGQARVQVEAERLRNTLLSSVSHDLRTPLAAITGAASSLVEDGERFDAPTRRDLAQTIYEEAARLNRLVGNLLDMTRLESGTAQVHKEWQSLEEIIGGALARMDALLVDRAVDVRLPPDLPLVPCDGVLVEQVLANLLENAAKYTPPHSPIDVQVIVDGRAVTVTVADRGTGFPAGDEQRVFDKFYRGLGAPHAGGAGLGLAISRAIVEAHGGRIWAANRPEGGAAFSFTLPMEGSPPALERTLAEPLAGDANPSYPSPGTLR